MCTLDSSQAKWDFATKRPKSRGKLADLAMSFPPDLRDGFDQHDKGAAMTQTQACIDSMTSSGTEDFWVVFEMECFTISLF
jgi:hypothetical protein